MRVWAPVASASTPPQAVRQALNNLSTCLVSGLAYSSPNTPVTTKEAFGQKVANAMETVVAVLKMAYLRRKEWGNDSDNLGNGIYGDAIHDYYDLQKEIRTLGKLVPLQAVAESPALHNLVFLEDTVQAHRVQRDYRGDAVGDLPQSAEFTPWVLWGCDKSDRLGVEALPHHMGDPCVEDEKENSEVDNHMQEYLNRHGDGSPLGNNLSLNQFQSTFAMIDGKKDPLTKDRDMAPHHLAVFSCAVLERLVKADDVSGFEATERVIELTRHEPGPFAGGDFLGQSLTISAGLGKYSQPPSQSRSDRFLRMPGGIGALVMEILQSGDDTHILQELLVTVAASDWASASVLDLIETVHHYVLASMDGRAALFSTGGGAEKSLSFITKVMATILEGHPSIPHYFETGDTSLLPPDKGFVHLMIPLMRDRDSAFAHFMRSRWLKEKQKLLKAKGNSDPSTLQVMERIVQKWWNLSKEERAGVRWNTLTPELKRRLEEQGEAPVDAIPLAQEALHGAAASAPHATGSATADAKDSNGEDENSGRMGGPAQAIPKCANCGAPEGLGVRLKCCSKCKMEKYCSSECQRARWPEHKAQCKALVKRNEANGKTTALK